MGAPVASGDVIAGKYRVERVLGQGGMGVVVAAMHVQLEQRVALKFLLAEGVANEEIVGRFLREAKSAVRLRSEHVARVLDVGQTEDGAPYIVMEYLDGRDLSNVLDDTGSLSVSAAVGYVLQACEAVAEAHAAGIVHRDLKPANLFLIRRNDGSPCIKVLDFGISKAIGPAADNLTKTSGMLGTPSYMSPEQMRSSKSVDTRSDIWALGMILYELVTGQVAFVQQTLPELCAAVLTDPTPPPRDHVPDLPAALEEAILRALAKSPNERFQNLAAFSAAIAPFAPGGDAARDRVARILGVPSGIGADVTQADPMRPSSVSLPDIAAPSSAADAAATIAEPVRPALVSAETLDPNASRIAAGADAPRPSPAPKILAVVALVAGLGLTAAWLRGRGAVEDGPAAAISAAAATSAAVTSAAVSTASATPSPSPSAAAGVGTEIVAPSAPSHAASAKPVAVKIAPKAAAPVSGKGGESEFGGRK